AVGVLILVAGHVAFSSTAFYQRRAVRKTAFRRRPIPALDSAGADAYIHPPTVHPESRRQRGRHARRDYHRGRPAPVDAAVRRRTRLGTVPQPEKPRHGPFRRARRADGTF